MSYLEDWEKQRENEALEDYIRARVEAGVGGANPGPIMVAGLATGVAISCLIAVFVWLARAYS